MSKEEIKKKLHEAIEESVNPRDDLHEMYKERMKYIVSEAIFCYLMQSPEANFKESEELVIMEHIRGFIHVFVEEICIKGD